ncbi:efflux RND transporter permease subunit [Haliea sp.]|uniref:efflux RND transporter permease subunit n=1 Tax=Haliea sp. TaxID=1932666 RepID=UPI000C5871CA|nr:efflux RND transporter permease subunit [Haliea sp.]HCD55243.1 CusA/CzcA family heavy metal efflux RND transporter [Halieaceae bacterium]MAD62719.1 CusA/CzcA family heavy metal efflux RND transporter [Haliea sp.]MAY91655.1 CusA/CzcA family heavy metal efflux RND transporter [Haliea sp.]MBK40638.1 CusA/CzcA family heavy metal efflux RND transporter [Haliea sp.]MBP68737.1 CusA/CzcA family heavy metal efflux RND transporter [Haliea sp.]|tara:strand:+ start:11500 stop:14694 length:3195 start_codon:yes stop_codon:yes gene_type:complete
MIKAIINASLRDRFMVLVATFIVGVVGIFSYKNVPLDAIPDLSDVQVIIFTKYPGQSPQVVEDQVTYPLTTSMLAVPDTKVVRGYSFFGLSFVYIIFEDGTDMYWARSRVLESINYVSGRLPQGVTPTLGPDATGVGWVYEYALVDRSGKHDLAELRSLQDWYLRYPLQTVNGVSEVASVGGFVKQYQVEVDPNALLRYNIPLDKVRMAIKMSNKDVGGRLVEMAETEYMVRGLGYIQSIDDLNSIPVSVDENGTPIRLRDVANVQIGPELRRGLVDLNGEGEVAGGVVIMRFGENALATIQAVREKLEELKAGLPEGVEIVPVYDRGDLIERAVDSLNTSLAQELVIVSIVVILFLLHARSAFVVIITLPLGVLMAFIVMRIQGLNANIMSLGGIAITIGTMVDGAIVMVENAHSRLAMARDAKGSELTIEERWKTIGESCQEVGPALFFSLLVITVSFLPIFTMQAQEGRLFSPLAFTATYAMAASAILAITLVPVMMGYFLRGKIIAEHKNPLNRALHALHRPALKTAMRWRVVTVVCAIALLGATYYPYSKLGSEFMPPLDEGDILYMPTTFPGISITKAKELLQQTDKILATFPEVHHVFGKVGRAETATDSAPLAMIETTVRLKPKEEWPDPGKTTKELMSEMDAAIQFPGLANAWTMPIKTRIDMLSTGIKTPIGIKVSGPDLNVLQEVSQDIEQAMKTLPETTSAFGDRAVGGYYLDFDINRESAARYGLTVGAVQDVIQSAIGGMNITETVEGLERYPVNLRYPRELRDDLETLKRVIIPTPTGAQIPLALVAEINYTRGPPVIKSEDARPNAWIYVDISTSDIGGFVTKAKEVVNQQVDIPAGYTLTWSGQFEYMERAAKRLSIVAPATLFIIFLLLYFNFRNVIEPVVVMISIPFGLIGGIWLIYFNDYNVSVAVAVGFIALAGMAAEIGVLVLSFIDTEIAERRSESARRLTLEEIRDSVLNATSKRVRPVAMTAISTMAGLIPIMLSSGTGSDVTHRIAAPMLGGMLTVMILNLLVLPVIYSFVLQFQEKRRVVADSSEVQAADGPAGSVS